jgi:hypothetical protein
MDLALIQAHHGVEDTICRHLPTWVRSADRVVFVTTEQTPLKLGVEQIRRGSGSHHGKELAERLIEMFVWSLGEVWDRFQLLEYDAFSLARAKVPDGGMAATVFPQNQPGAWAGKSYFHYPHFYSRTAVEKLLPHLIDVYERGEPDMAFSDRHIGRAAELAGIPVRDLRAEGLGFSRNTVKEKHWPALDSAVRSGARFFHGIKDVDTFRRIIR